MAVDRASPGRLKALAVLAFWAEMTRLPGHWSPAVAAGKYNGFHDTVPVHDGRPHVQAKPAVLLLYGAPEGLTECVVRRQIIRITVYNRD